jgi:hypothetical protein
MLVPGDTPKFPTIEVPPELVTPEAPNTEKLAAVPNPGAEAFSGFAKASWDKPNIAKDIAMMVVTKSTFSSFISYNLLLLLEPAFNFFMHNDGYRNPSMHLVQDANLAH